MLIVWFADYTSMLALVEFTDPNRVWSESYKVTDESQVTVRRMFIGNGTPYPYMTARVRIALREG